MPTIAGCLHSIIATNMNNLRSDIYQLHIVSVVCKKKMPTNETFHIYSFKQWTQKINVGLGLVTWQSKDKPSWQSAIGDVRADRGSCQVCVFVCVSLAISGHQLWLFRAFRHVELLSASDNLPGERNLSSGKWEIFKKGMDPKALKKPYSIQGLPRSCSRLCRRSKL